ncbi:MAG: hypothetical protein P8123_01955 [bacterium]
MKKAIPVVIACGLLFSLVTLIMISPANGAAEDEKGAVFHCWKCKKTFTMPASAMSGQCPHCGARFARKLPSPTPKPEPAVISWEDGANYVGKTKTVEGVVVGTHLSSGSGNLYLNFSQNYRTGLSAQIPAAELRRFRSDAASYYQNKKVSAKGLIHRQKGFLRIKVVNPEDLKVIE